MLMTKVCSIANVLAWFLYMVIQPTLVILSLNLVNVWLLLCLNRNKEHPDLKLWCHPWKHITVDEKIHTKHIIHIEENCCKEETTSYRTWNGTAEKPSAIPSVEESYITSEHCYQKPRAYYPAIEQRLVVETRGSAMDEGVNRIRENGDDVLSERLGWNLDREICKMENESKHNYSKVFILK